MRPLLYTFSAVPLMYPPPTQVAWREETSSQREILVVVIVVVGYCKWLPQFFTVHEISQLCLVGDHLFSRFCLNYAFRAAPFLRL